MSADMRLMAMLPVAFVFWLLGVCATQEVPLYKRVRDCLGQPMPVICLKIEALDVLNQTVMSDQPLTIYDTFDIVKDSNYAPNATDEMLPEDVTERSAKLNELLYSKVEEFIQSRTLRLNLGNVIEGRKKGGGGGGGKGGKMGMALMMGAVGMAGMMAHLFMGKIAFLAGAALLIAKLALFLSAISGLKKMSGGGGGGGGETQHVVYAASSGDYGHSHGGGGGGWHRSLSANDHAQDVVYRAHITTPENNFAYKK